MTYIHKRKCFSSIFGEGVVIALTVLTGMQSLRENILFQSNRLKKTSAFWASIVETSEEGKYPDETGTVFAKQKCDRGLNKQKTRHANPLRSFPYSLRSIRKIAPSLRDSTLHLRKNFTQMTSYHKQTIPALVMQDTHSFRSQKGRRALYTFR